MGGCAPCGCSEYDRKDRHLRTQLPRIDEITGISNLKELKLDKVSQVYLHDGEKDTSLNSEILSILLEEYKQSLGMNDPSEENKCQSENYTLYAQ